MDKSMPNLGFRMMGLFFKVRDFLQPRIDILKEIEIEPGFRVLDFGCGPGSYIAPLIQLVGASGEIYALDIHLLAIKKVQNMASQKGVENVTTIQSDCATRLPDNYLDVVLLYDIFHDLSQPNDVLRELHRVLKPSGTLSFSDHHMKEQDILRRITNVGLFGLSAKGRMTYSFLKKS